MAVDGFDDLLARGELGLDVLVENELQLLERIEVAGVELKDAFAGGEGSARSGAQSQTAGEGRARCAMGAGASAGGTKPVATGRKRGFLSLP